MKILALETSARACSAAVTQDGQILAACCQNSGLTHSRTLMPRVESMLKNADLPLDGMDAVDDHLNDHGYIVPGLGDAGDRIFGTK